MIVVQYILNAYDHRNRRTAKTVQRLVDGEWTTCARHDFVYDGWNLVHESVAAISGVVTNVTETEYFWGSDLSGTLQGVGGIGGLLAVSRDGRFYFPAYDNNGNAMKYVDESGAVVAAYVYDDFGRILSRTGPLADAFMFRHATKYFDAETGLSYYGRRFLHPVLRCWLTRDPIGERGGVNLYAFVKNRTTYALDMLGMSMGCLGPSSGSDPSGVLRLGAALWMAIYGDTAFRVHRKVTYNLCPCKGGKPLTQTYNYFSVPTPNVKKEFKESGGSADLYYEEIFAISADSVSDHKGTLSVWIEVVGNDVVPPTNKKPPLPKETEGFGTEARNDKSEISNHPVVNYDLTEIDWKPTQVSASISFVLELDCEGEETIKDIVKSGDWGLNKQGWQRNKPGVIFSAQTP